MSSINKKYILSLMTRTLDQAQIDELNGYGLCLMYIPNEMVPRIRRLQTYGTVPSKAALEIVAREISDLVKEISDNLTDGTITHVLMNGGTWQMAELEKEFHAIGMAPTYVFSLRRDKYVGHQKVSHWEHQGFIFK